MWIVGSNPAPPVNNLASEIIDVTGYVTEYELVSKYAEARVAVVPLRFGAGVKLKVVEALWEGLPLVTTSIGAQGLEGLGEVATVVDEAEPLARELVRLLRDDGSWVEQAQRQLDYAQVHFSRQASIEALREATSAAAANAEKAKARRYMSAGLAYFCADAAAQPRRMPRYKREAQACILTENQRLHSFTSTAMSPWRLVCNLMAGSP